MEAASPINQASDSVQALSVAILAGGASSRMGAPKPGLDLAGRPMISYAIETAEAAGLAPIVVAKRGAALPPLRCPVLEEPAEPRHPLAGVIAALEDRAAPIVVLACDVPLVPAALLTRLAAVAAPFAMPSHPRAQPLVARYAPSLLPRLRDELASGAAMTAIAASLGGVRLGDADLADLGDPEWTFANANDPAELARIGAEIRRRRQAA